MISSFLDLQIQKINTHVDKINWLRFSYNKSITFDHVLAYPDKHWDWCALSWNPNITFDNVTLDHMFAYPDKPWDWHCVSSNPNFLKMTESAICDFCGKFSYIYGGCDCCLAKLCDLCQVCFDANDAPACPNEKIQKLRIESIRTKCPWPISNQVVSTQNTNVK
jgi:hypothetical protein